MTDFQLVYRGFIHDSQGYSRAAREYIIALHRAGVDVKVDPIPLNTPPVKIEKEKSEILNQLISKPFAENKRKVLLYHAQPDGVDPVYERNRGYDKVIIQTVWETTKVPDSWVPSANQADAIFVPCTQNKKVLEDSGVITPIYIVPHGADIHFFHPGNKPIHINGLNNDLFVFLSVFQWQHRKSPDVLFKAFWSEFTSQDKVALVVKSYWGNHGRKQDQRWVRDTIIDYKARLGFTDTAPVFYTGSIMPDETLKGLYALADVFVLPSRGEGVGLPYIEAMCSGIPAIATGWGGQTDFINESNGYLVDYQLEPTQLRADKGIAPNFVNLFTNEMLWAEPSVDSLRKIMRHCYMNQDEVKEKGQKARKDMEKMTWEQIGANMKNTIELVVSKGGGDQ